MKTICILAALALATPATALAAAPKGDAAAAATASSNGGDASAERKVCRRDYSTGSRTATQKTCMTKAQWRAFDRGGEEALQRELSRQR